MTLASARLQALIFAVWAEQGIGLTLEEAMRFWRMEFAPKCPSDQFEKKYAYNVRYNYGREGRKSDYTPYSCLKVISSQPGQVGRLSRLCHLALGRLTCTA